MEGHDGDAEPTSSVLSPRPQRRERDGDGERRRVDVADA